MSTSNKLTYLNETKQELKQAINNLGGSITDQTTFRNYVSQLENVYDNLPKTSFQEGTEVTIENGLKAKIDFDTDSGKKIVGYGDTEQATRQYIDVGSWEQGTVDGSTGNNATNSGMIRTMGYIEVKPNVLYEISRSIYNSFMVFRFYDSSKTYLGSQATSGMVTTNQSENRMAQNVSSMTMTINNTNVAYMRLSDASNDTSTIYTIYTDNTPSPVYPQPIQCVTGNQDVVVSGKNELNLNGLETKTNLGITITPNYNNGLLENIKISGTPSSNSWNVLKEFILASGTYVLNGLNIEDTTKTGLRIGMYVDTPRQYFICANSPTLTFTLSEPTSIRFVVWVQDTSLYPTTDTYITPMLRKASITDDTYEPYKTPKTYQLSLGNNKFYKIGDYADELLYDVDEDKVYKNEKIKKVIINSSYRTSGGTTGTNAYYIATSLNDGLNDNSNILAYSNMFKGISFDNRSGAPDSVMLQSGSVTLRTRNNTDIDWSDNTKRDAWLNANTPLVYYVLATPVEIPITDTTLINQVKALYNAHSNNGTTIITSNGNLSMIIKVRALKGE